MIAHTSSAAIRSGPPQRGASRKRSATVPRTPAPESHRARQALTVLRQIPSLSAVPSIPRPSPKSNTMRARIAGCCGVKDARIRRSSPSRSSSLNSILAALRPISSLHREIIATENQTTENKSLICESELTPTCTRAAVGRKLAEPERTVVATVGDAGLEMFLGELATVRDLKLAIPIVVFVDRQLGLIELKQRSSQLPGLAVEFGTTGFATTKPLPGRSGQRSRVRLSRSSPLRSVHDPMMEGFDAHPDSRDPGSLSSECAARPNIPRHFGRLNGPREMPRSRRTAPRSAPACSCRIFHPVCLQTRTGSSSERATPSWPFRHWMRSSRPTWPPVRTAPREQSRPTVTR